MSSTNDNAALRGYAYAYTNSNLMTSTPDVRAIPGTGVFAIEWGHIKFHVTAEWWNSVDTTVRAGIAAAQTEAASL